jgi:exonuclease V gamma subunit
MKMSILYLGSDPRSLAEQLADDLDRQAREGDFFAPATIVVPNRFLQRWLRLFLARRLDVAINLKFQVLEAALWDLLRELDPSAEAAPPESIDDNIYRLMVLSILLEEKGADLAPLQRYLQLQEPKLSRLSCRRAWHLADRLGARLRDYEYSRQDILIQAWLAGHLGLASADAFHKMMERAQRAVFCHITDEPNGKRALLNRHTEKTCKTFPQYAMERMTQPEPLGQTSEVFKTSEVSRDLFSGTSARRVVHFFGFTQISELHIRTIAWLGQHFDVRLHHLNVLASRYSEWIKEKDRRINQGDDLFERSSSFLHPCEGDPGRELLRLWGRAGEESLGLMEHLRSCGNFEEKMLPAHERSKLVGQVGELPPQSSVLRKLSDQLLANPAAAKDRLAQDTSLQIAGCPGIAREVETVYNSILHNLQVNATLRQTDVAILVTDMAKYRAALQSVFERPPRRLQYNMVDFSAAGISMFGQALLGMLDLALESFSRARVFRVILNPCFLARLGCSRAEATAWLEWAESLGICQGWDAEEKAQQGYSRSPFYAWRLGLQRLRLGRFMEIQSDESEQPAPRFGYVIPFADLASTDREQLDAFCRAVEGLLPTLARLRSSQLTGKGWTNTLTELVSEFLEVPADRPEEAQVRAVLLDALEKLATWDDLHDAARKTASMPLALAREYVQSQLDMLQGKRGEYLIGGVTISELQAMRPVPFPLVYVVGLGEENFPGSNALSSIDLRGAQRIPGDIRPAENRLYDFLATVLSAQQKLYLLYNNHDLQKDQLLLPAVPLLQLQRYLNENILQGPFCMVDMPAQADDARYLDPAQQPAYQDIYVQPRDTDRCLALLAADKENRLALDRQQEAEWADKRGEFQKDFRVPPCPAQRPETATTVTLTELRRFLYLPAQESLRRHLRVEEEDEQGQDDDEPLVTTQQMAGALVRQTIQQLVLAAAKAGAQEALGAWKERFLATYADSHLRSRVPEEAFGEIDRGALLSDLQERIHGQGRIEAFLRGHAGMTFCGPVLLGESLTPLGARKRFPALCLRPGHELAADAAREIRIVGSTSFAWQEPGRFEILIVTNSKEVRGEEISLAMIEPALLMLALLASYEPNADGMSGNQWLARRECLLNVSHQGGIQTWSYPPGDITPAEAMNYFVHLTRDFLDPAQFDLLPFEIVNKRGLSHAYREGLAAQMTPESYRTLVEDAITDMRENAYRGVKVPLLVDMVGARVPADALAKVQRRFRLLDRGPARLREQPRTSKGWQSPKS